MVDEDGSFHEIPNPEYWGTLGIGSVTTEECGWLCAISESIELAGNLVPFLRSAAVADEVITNASGLGRRKITTSITKNGKSFSADSEGAGSSSLSGGGVPTPEYLAQRVADISGGSLKRNKGGYTVTVPYKRNGIVVRIMKHGGDRTNYYRIGVPGKESYTVDGEVSTDRSATHINIDNNSEDDIFRIIATIKGEWEA